MNAAVYARKSTEQAGVAADQKSVARQVEHARAFAEAHGWTVADGHMYVDDGISGAEFANRPGFLRLMNALKPRAPFQVLIMSEESRLGREAIETAYALKQLIQAGVRVFFYLENRERTLDSPTDKIMLSLTTFADELEREKARQRTYDAMLRKAKAGHVTGGRVFGYDNVEIRDAAGERSHVQRRINEREAAVVRQIFEWSAMGLGMKAIAKRLNTEGAPTPRAQQGRSCSWAPSSVREALFRDLYRGLITWNRTRKRDRWGQHRQAPRPSSDWLELPAPGLRIVSEAAWQSAHARLAEARVKFTAADGRKVGRPPLGTVSKYLLTNLALCGRCGGPLRVRSRKHGNGQKFFYGCAGYHERGRAICANQADVPMADADEIVIEALLDDVLDTEILGEAVDQALSMVRGEAASAAPALEEELETIEGERDRLVAAIVAGGQLAGLLEALRKREERLAEVRARLAAVRRQERTPALDVRRVRKRLEALAADWRRVLAKDPEHARPIVSSLLKGRVTFTPDASDRRRWELRGEATLSGLFVGEMFPSEWRPQRESYPRESPFCGNSEPPDGLLPAAGLLSHHL